MPTKYVFCDCHNKYEAYDKSEVLAVLQQAIDDQSLVNIDSDAGFITKIKEMNADAQLKFWVGTTAEFNAIETKAADTLYILTDDDSAASLDAIATGLESVESEITDIIDGTTTVLKATNAENTELTNGEWEQLNYDTSVYGFKRSNSASFAGKNWLVHLRGEYTGTDTYMTRKYADIYMYMYVSSDATAATISGIHSVDLASYIDLGEFRAQIFTNVLYLIQANGTIIYNNGGHNVTFSAEIKEIR